MADGGMRGWGFALSAIINFCRRCRAAALCWCCTCACAVRGPAVGSWRAFVRYFAPGLDPCAPHGLHLRASSLDTCGDVVIDEHASKLLAEKEREREREHIAPRGVQFTTCRAKQPS